MATAASANFAQAASGAGGTWADPQIKADWLGDGYGTAGSVAVLVRDGFERVSSSGWSDPNQTTLRQWTLNTTATDFTITGGSPQIGAVAAVSGTAYQSHSAVNSLHRALIDTGSTDITVSAKVTVPVVPTGAGITSWVTARGSSDGNDYYVGRLDIAVNGLTALVLLRRSGGSLSGALASATMSHTHVAGDSWMVKLQVSGSTVRAKAWPLPGTEPAAWQVSTTDTTLTTGTYAGLLTRLETGNTNTLPIAVGWQSFRSVASAVDDLSGQAGGWSVSHFLDDGYPDQVTFVSGVGIPSAKITLDTPAPYLTGGPVRAAELYSPYNQDSPVYGLDRDIAPVVINHGLVTASGVERVRVFTGQMTDIPVKGGKATMTATSATRLKLSQLVQAPAVERSAGGLNGTWPVSWALHKCAVRPSPPARTGIRWWTPMHGAFRPHLPDNNPLVHLDDAGGSHVPAYRSARKTSTNTADQTWDVTWVTGPYVQGSDTKLSADESRRLFATDIELYASAGASTDLLSTAGNTGRLEFWVKGIATDVNNAPGGSGTISNLVSFTAQNGAATRKFQMGINTSRKVFVTVTDGAGHTASLTSTAALPTDGAWYFVGAAYSVSGKKLWVTNDFAAAGGALTTETAAASTLVTSSLPSADIWGSGHPQFLDYLPIAEVQLTGGSEANPDTSTTWLRDVSWSRTAQVSPSKLELTALVVKEPIEAWAWIAGFAQSELAAMRTDETDVFTYLTPGWWVKPEQQVVTEIVSTDINSEAIDVNTDYSKIRNSIKVSYKQYEIDTIFTPVYQLSQQLFIGIGVTEVYFPFQAPVLALKNSSGNDIFYADDADFDLYNNAIPMEYVSLNTSSDGSGTYATEFDDIVIEKVRWNPGGVVWRFTNPGPLTYYTANSKNQPAMKVFGRAAHEGSAYAQLDDQNSIDNRGPRSLSVSPAGIQTDTDARRLAGWLRIELRDPLPLVEDFTLFGDPRRTPGDLIQLQDPTTTRINAQWRYTRVDHDWKVTGGSADYTQDVTVRPTAPVGVWGSGTWGDCLWSYLT